MPDTNEPLTPEIVDGEIIDETGDDNTESGLIAVTGYNTNVPMTPVKCDDCEYAFFITPGTIEEINHCPSCGVEFTSYDDEF